MISFLNLEYFLVAAEELNFTRAARKLHTPRQSLSNRIPNLEKEFNMILSNRIPPLTLTYAGRVLKTRAGELLDLRGETYKEISNIEDSSTGQFPIGVPHTRGRIVLSEVLPIYQSRFPGIEFHLARGDSSQLVSDLLRGSIDLMIDLLPFTAENVETVSICNEEILMVVPDDILEKTYPDQIEEMKGRLRAISDVWILEHCPFVLLKKGNRVHTVADEIFEDAQMSPRIVLETEDIEIVSILSGRGMGIAFYPKASMSPNPASRSYRSAALEQNHLNLYSLNYTRAYGVLGIGYHKSRYMSRAAHEFICIAKERLDYAPEK